MNSITPNSSSEDDSLPLPVIKNSMTESFPEKRLSRILLVILPVIAVVFFAFKISHRNSGTGEETTGIAAANQGIFALGRLEPEGEVIGVAAPGGSGDSRIETLKVEEGSKVKAGDILAVLDNEKRLLAAIKVAGSSVTQAKANLAKTIREVETTTDQLRAALLSMEARVETARTKVSRYKLLVRDGGVSKDRLDDAMLELKTASEMKREAEARLNRYASASDADTETVDVALSRSEVAKAESMLLQATENLEQSLVRAPQDGTILRLNLRPGERINQMELLEMGNIAKMMVRIEVYESDVATLQVGQKVILSASPLAIDLNGKVERIGTLVRQQEIVDSDPAANTDARVIEVWARLEDDSQRTAVNFVNLQVRARFVP